MPFPGGRFLFLPGAHCREIMAGPWPSRHHYRRLPRRTRRLRGLRRPANETAAAAQAATPLPRPAPLEGQTWATAARLPAGEARGRGREKASGLAPGPWVPLAWNIGPRPSPSAPSRSSRQQSSRPPPPPPATPESWQWQWQRQRRKGERRRLPPYEPQPADRAAPTTTSSAQEPTFYRLLSCGGAVSLRTPFASSTRTKRPCAHRKRVRGLIFVGHLGAAVPPSVWLQLPAL